MGSVLSRGDSQKSFKTIQKSPCPKGKKKKGEKRRDISPCFCFPTEKRRGGGLMRVSPSTIDPGNLENQKKKTKRKWKGSFRLRNLQTMGGRNKKKNGDLAWAKESN